MITSDPSCIACSRTLPADGLPAASRRASVFDAVVDRVADQMEKGVRQLVQHATIQLGVAASHLPADRPCPERETGRGPPAEACR